MIMSENAEAFEVFLNDVPDGAETLLIEGEFLRVLGSLNGTQCFIGGVTSMHV